jgi:hypothetical protein
VRPGVREGTEPLPDESLGDEHAKDAVIGPSRPPPGEPPALVTRARVAKQSTVARAQVQVFGIDIRVSRPSDEPYCSLVTVRRTERELFQ